MGADDVQASLPDFAIGSGGGWDAKAQGGVDGKAILIKVSDGCYESLNANLRKTRSFTRVSK